MKQKDGDGASSSGDGARDDAEKRGNERGGRGQNRSEQEGRQDDRGARQSDGRGGHGSENGGFPGLELIERATERLSRLTGKRAESVSAVVPSDDGWRMTVEVVELERVPETTSVLGTYEAEIDEDGRLVSYERTRRYMRNQADG